MLGEARFNLRARLLTEVTNENCTARSCQSNQSTWNGLGCDHQSPVTTHLHHRTTTMTTKQEILKNASKLFDPLGITSPVSVRAKLFMQKLWHLHVNWDEPLDAIGRMDHYLDDFQKLSELAATSRRNSPELISRYMCLLMLASRHMEQYPSLPVVVK